MSARAGACAVALRRRDPLDDRVEHVLDAGARLRRDAKHAVGVVGEQVGELLRDAVGVGLRQVDLVDERDDLEVVLDREVGVRERLRLDPLRRVGDEQRALARLQRARDLVGEVDVARRVDQVQLVALPQDPHRLRLDRDPALALEVHRVEHLRAHLALRDGVRELEDAIGERRLAVVDVRDDREVADVLLVHGLTGDGSRARPGAAGRGRSSLQVGLIGAPRSGHAAATAKSADAVRPIDRALESTGGERVTSMCNGRHPRPAWTGVRQYAVRPRRIAGLGRDAGPASDDGRPTSDLRPAARRRLGTRSAEVRTVTRRDGARRVASSGAR